MMTGQNYSGEGDSTTLTNKIEQTAKNGRSSQPTNPTQRLKPELGIELGLSAHTGSGCSAIEVAIFALTEYRDSRLKMFVEHLQQNELQNAFACWKDQETASDLLTQIALDQSRAIDNNYFAAEGRHEGHHEWHRKSYLERFFKMTGTTPEEYEASNA